MATTEDKLDTLGAQVGAVLIELARLSANVEALSRDSQRSSQEVARDLADHEVRLRTIEGHHTAGLSEQVDSLRTWRARVIGYAAGAAAASGAVTAGLVELIARATTHHP